MKYLLAGLILCGSTLSGSLLAGQQPWSIDGGSLQLQLYPGLLRDLGIEHRGRVGEQGNIQFDLPIGPQGNLEFLTSDGGFEKFIDGSLPLGGALQLQWKGGAFPESGLRLVPGNDVPPSLYLQDEQGRRWFRLSYGHFLLHKEQLILEVMDLRLGPEFAKVLGDPALLDVFVGAARLATRINRQATGSQAKFHVIPNWPTEPGFSIDIEMLRMASVNQIARFGGRVAIAPSAYFENIGNGDAPWFSMFTLPASEHNCFDTSGQNACDPYATDQGGILVFAFYRILDGRIEQIGLSAAKHAFNSVNFSTATEIGSVPCRASGSARVVWSGCEDVYSTGTNADRSFLGPRSEITAHTGVWARVGSIFDQDSDGLCDPAFDQGPFVGGRRCLVPASDALDRRLHVDESALGLSGARYFMESWYVVRDDFNIFNSMGFREVSPALSTLWTFQPTAGTDFEQGSVLSQWVDDETIEADESSALLNTFEGRVRVAMRAESIAAGRFRYRIAVMNHDFDRQIDSISLPLPAGAGIMETAHFDGDPDGNMANGWQATVSASELRWDAPAGQAIDWGVLHSFEFSSALPPVRRRLTLGVAESGLPESFNVSSLGLDDGIFLNGFEGD